MRFTLSKKIIFTIGTGMIFASILLGASAFIFISQISRDATNERLNSISHLKSSYINKYISERVLEIKDLVEKKEIKKDLQNILLGDMNLKEGQAVIDSIKDRYLTKNNVLDLSLLDNSGNVLISTDRQEIGKIKNIEDFFYSSTSNIKVDHFKYDFSTKKIITIIYGPIKDQDNNIIGILQERIDVKAINEILKNQEGLGSTGETFLVNPFNFVVTDLLKEPNSVLTRSIYLSQINDCLSGNSNYYSLKDYNNDEVYGYARWIPGIKSCLVTKIDKKEIITPVMQPLPRVIVFFVIILVITLWAGFYVGESIIKPIRNLRNKAIRIKNGDLGVVVKQETNDEIGDLANVFKEMIHKLRNVYEGLEEKVKERTLELKKSEEQLKEALRNSEEMASIVRGSNEPIFSQDLEGKILSWNIGAENLFGYSAKEAIGNSVELFVPEDRRQEIENVSKTIMSGEKIERYQTVIKKKSGAMVDVAVSFSPIKNIQGVTTAMSVVVIDITKERQIDKVKTEFVSIASHQFRTPLSTMNWYAEMLLSEEVGPINESQKKYLQEISIANKRMVGLVDDLLSVSRLEMGKFVLDLTSIDLVKVLDCVIKEFSPQIIKKELKIQKKYKQKSLNFIGDDKLVRIIFQNLLSNSIKYSAEKSSLEIHLLIVKKGEVYGGKTIPRDSVLFSISDKGVGIPLDQQDKVFSKLFRADNIKKTEPDGTGLGLYVVKSIADQSDGLVWFTSKENEGSIFYVAYPISGMTDKLDEGEIVE